MEVYYPTLLSRQKAMLFANIGRIRLESLARNSQVRTFTTRGGHKRYFRDDLTKYLNEILQK